LAESSSPPIIFLLGPPGVGKSTLGSRACRDLELEFLDLAATPVAAPGDGEYTSNLADGAELGQREGLACILSMCPHPECACQLVYCSATIQTGPRT